MDDISVTAYTTDELIQNIEIVFQCVKKAGLKLSLDSCSFVQERIEFSSKTISSQRIRRTEKNDDFLEKLEIDNAG